MRYTVEQACNFVKEYFELEGLYFKSYHKNIHREIVYPSIWRCKCGGKVTDDSIVDITFDTYYDSNKELGIDEPCLVVLVNVTCICDCGKVRTRDCEIYTKGMLEGE